MIKCKKIAVLMCIILTFNIIPIASIGVVAQNTQTNDIIMGDGTYNIVNNILSESNYDIKDHLKEAQKIIYDISQNIDGFDYWNNSEIIVHTLLHSYYTGKITNILFDIKGLNGSYGYLILNYDNYEIREFAATDSPYRIQEKAFNNFITTESKYLFYAPDNYGYGIINEYGEVDIYDVHNIYTANNMDVYKTTYNMNYNVAQNVQFQETEPVLNKARIIEGDVELYTLRATKNSRISYPSSYILPGVPDYQQDGTHLCINISMSNIIGYWDQNGKPNLIPSGQSIEYVKPKIQSCLVAAGGAGNNSSINSAFKSYIKDHGNYSYAGGGIWNPAFEDLQGEVYGFSSPCLIGFPTVYGGGHMTTGVGFSTLNNTKMVIVHDNWPSTDVNKYQNWSDVDYLFYCII